MFGIDAAEVGSEARNTPAPVPAKIVVPFIKSVLIIAFGNPVPTSVQLVPLFVVQKTLLFVTRELLTPTKAVVPFVVSAYI